MFGDVVGPEVTGNSVGEECVGLNDGADDGVETVGDVVG